jgi:glycosyltransferase involved in cell wall biosynthesis
MLAHYKKIEVAIEAFNQMPDKKLLIVWDGDFRWVLEKQAKENTIFVWAQYADDLVWFLQNAKWLIFPWEEDFWIVPVEALACSIPLFAYKWWGLLETNLEWITGEFFEDKNGNDFVWKFQKFDEKVNNNFYKKENIIAQAKKFWEKEFENKIKNLVYN